MNETLFERLVESQPAVVEPLRRMLFLLAPYDPVGVAQRRYGKEHDGGYVMLEDWPEEGLAYSFGVANDISWDTAMAAKGLPVYMYDHTIAALPGENALFHWSPIGLGTTDQPEEKLLSLETLLKNNGHHGRRDLILKIDIEGAEWAALLSFPDGLLDHFRQILVEFHDCSHFDDAAHVQTMLQALGRLNVSHRVVHLHANNCGAYDLVGGIPFPSVLELSYVRQDVCATTPSQRVFPTPLDRPNDAARADYVLPFWGLSLSDQVAAEERAQQAEERAWRAEEWTRQAENRAWWAEERARRAEERAQQVEDRTQQAEDRAQQAEEKVASTAEHAWHLQERIFQLQHSTSWRITRPLRGLKRLVRGELSCLRLALNALIRFLLRHPALWRVLKRPLKSSPWLWNHLQNMAGRLHAPPPRQTLDLSPRARQIHKVWDAARERAHKNRG